MPASGPIQGLDDFEPRMMELQKPALHGAVSLASKIVPA